MIKLLTVGLLFFASTLASGTSAPTAYLQRVDNPSEMVTLDYKSKVTLLIFWNANCASCKGALREAEKARDLFHSAELKVYGVMEDPWQNYDVRGKVQMKSDLPQLYDAGLRMRKAFNSPPIPSWVLVGVNGNVFGRAQSAAEQKRLLQTIKSQLSGKGGEQ